MARKKKEQEKETKVRKPRVSTKYRDSNVSFKYLVISGRDEMKISQSGSGTLEDITMTGLIFRTKTVHVDEIHISYDESPVIRNRLTLEIDLPGSGKVTVMGVVSWYERSLTARDQIYHVGVTFMEISPEDREALRGYLVATKRTGKAITLDV
jgi:hypothetical protein